MNEWFPVVGATKEERLVSRMAMSRASFCKVVVAWLVSKFEVDPDLFVGVEEVSCLSLVSDLMLSRQTIDRLTAWLAKRIEGSAKHDVSFGVCRTVGDLADAVLQACDAQDRIEQANEREFLMHARMRELRLQCQKSADDDHSRVERVAFRVATFNVDAFASQSSIATASVCRSIRRAVESGCDVLCLQEVTALWKERMQADGCIKSFRYAEFHFDDRTGAGGLAVLSCFPIVDFQVFPPSDAIQGSFFPFATCKIVMGNVNLQVCNVHLRPGVYLDSKLGEEDVPFLVIRFYTHLLERPFFNVRHPVCQVGGDEFHFEALRFRNSVLFVWGFERER
jgi:hypothetical protein